MLFLVLIGAMSLNLIGNAPFLVTEHLLRAFLLGAAYFTTFALLLFVLRNTEAYAFPIVLTLALLFTASAVVMAFADGPAAEVSIGALALWFLIPDSVRIQRLLSQPTDLPAAHKKEALRFALTTAAFIALLGIGMQTWIRLAAPPDPTSALESFALAWNSNSHAAVASTTPPSETTRFERQLGIVAERYDWGHELPPIGPATWKPLGPNATTLEARFPTPLGPLVVAFRLQDDTWYTTKIDARKIKTWRPTN
jgi:hypothetical protein